MAKMGGRFVPLPVEVIELLVQKGPSCFTLYVIMLKEFHIQHITDTDGMWVAGKIHATKYEIGKKVSKSSGNFYDKVWPSWVEIEVVEMKDGGVYLPKLYKKGDAYLQPLRMREEIDQLRARQGEMQETIQNLQAALSVSRNVITSQTSSERTESVLSEDGSFLCEEALSLLIEKEEISLSEMNKLISAFYRSIGRNRISKTVRDKAIVSFKNLMAGGFLPGEIAYALDWIPKNATEPVKHFGIVAHMIDQAIAAGKKKEEIEEAKAAMEEERLATEHSRLLEQQQRDAFKNYKAGLPKEERHELRNNAILKLRGTPGIMPDMILDGLVEATENDLIRDAGVDVSALHNSDIE